MSKVNLKGNFWIEGFGCFLDAFHNENYPKSIWAGKTSEIPEEIAKECVEYSYMSGYYILDYPEPEFPYTFLTAKNAILAICDKPYCIIYKTSKHE